MLPLPETDSSQQVNPWENVREHIEAYATAIADTVFSRLSLAPIPLVFKQTKARKWWGRFWHKMEVNDKLEEVPTGMHIQLNVDMIVKDSAGFEQVRKTMLHELAHYYQVTKLGYTSHDYRFEQMDNWLNALYPATTSFTIPQSQLILE